MIARGQARAGSVHADEEALRRCLERIVPRVRAGSPAITAVHRNRSEHSTSYDTYVVTADLSMGEALEVFVKDFGRTVRLKDGAERRRAREVRVYRDLLPGTELGTAAYYGSILDESHGRFWLFLEFVDGTPVGYRELDAWSPAVVGLARVHGCFAGRTGRLPPGDFLLRHDAEFFWSRADQALAAVAQVAPRLAGRVADLVRRYAPIVEIMASQPPALVHGGCRPSNVLIDVASDPSRVCIVDWEEAGVGAPLFDVAHLLDGVEPPALDRLLDAYRQEALACGVSLPSREDTKYVLECFRLHMTMALLGRAALHGYDERSVAKVLGLGERIGNVVFRRPGSARGG